ncbi:MAG: gfo/Idh/MocA family oxidoreductase, partial [Candidatus Hydrogenedentes bacterium]|nr:gfo/Idh/MocA family oxidoreductase [Candidatus Hydrogenedentota bacterium]
MDGHDNGVIFYGDKGTVEVGRQGCFVTFIGEEPKQIGGGQDLVANVRNFLDCVKADNPAGLNAPISEGAVSAMLSNLGNIATRVNRRIVFDADRVECVGDEEATRLLSRTYREGYELPVVG